MGKCPPQPGSGPEAEPAIYSPDCISARAFPLSCDDLIALDEPNATDQAVTRDSSEAAAAYEYEV